MVVISQLDYSDEKTSLLNENIALYSRIMIVFRIAFPAPLFPFRLNFNKRYYVSVNYYKGRLKCQGVSQTLWACIHWHCLDGLAFYVQLPSSCIIVLTNGILINIATGPLPAWGSHAPQAKFNANFLLVALSLVLNTLLKQMMDK